jgi:CRP-like cAMP-binding protein
LLESLPQKEYKNIISLGKLVELHSGENLGEAGRNYSAVYFPVNCSVSLMTQVDGQPSMEIGIVGPEGMIGLNTVLNIKSSLLSSVVEYSGRAFRMDSNVFQQVHKKSTALQQILKNYIFVRLAQLSQSASCARFHVLDARFARWILTAQDSTNSSEFYVTHERLANKLGVQRGSITQAAGNLQKMKLISYSKGRIIILDRKGLETVTCGCYQFSKEVYKKIMK